MIANCNLYMQFDFTDLGLIENINGLPKLQISSNPLVNHTCIYLKSGRLYT